LPERKVVVEAIGWLSSLVLLATLVVQIRKQWRERATHGVSKWLFVGQFTASLGFTVYSAAVHNSVFVVTNAVLTASALIGCYVTVRNMSDERAGSGS
jgi:uncharacterized protein with PQ loop repeat